MKKLIILVLFCIIPIQALGAITSASISDGVLSISGSGFGNRSDNGGSEDYLPFKFLDIESGYVTSAASDSRATISTSNNRSGSSYNLLHKKDYSGSSFTTVTGITSTNTAHYGLKIPITAAKHNYFFSQWTRLSTDWDNIMSGDGSSQAKILMSTPSDGGKDYFSSAGYSNPPKLYPVTESGHVIGNVGPIKDYMPYGTWHRMDIWVSVPDSTTGYVDEIKWYVDGKLVYQDTQLGYSQSTVYPVGLISFVGYMAGSAYFSLQTDDHFIDFTEARVEISESSTWDETVQVHKEIQIPTAWSDTSITAELKQGSLPSDTAYVYVVTDDGTVLDYDSGTTGIQGYPITLGVSTPDTTAPTFTSASVNGTTVSVSANEVIVTTGGDLKINCSVAGSDINLSSPSGSGSSRTFTSATSVSAGDTCTMSGTLGANDIEDSAGNDMVSFSGLSVTVNTPAPQNTLTVSKDGTGTGVVVSSSGDINCGATCSDDYDADTSVNLTAYPDGSSDFTTWTDCDSVNGAVCTITVDTDPTTATATFTAASADSCDADHLWLCGDGACQTAGGYFYYGACQTIAQPGDIDTVVLTDTFTSWTGDLPDGWSGVRVAEDSGAVGLYATSTAAAGIYRVFPGEGVYRYILTVRNITTNFEVWNSFDGQELFSADDGANRTITGTMTYDGTGDSNFYLKAPVGSGTMIIDNFVLATTSTAQGTCGDAADVAVVDTCPSTDLCGAGSTASAVTNDGIYCSWTCTDESAVNCTAPYSASTPSEIRVYPYGAGYKYIIPDE